MGELPLTASAPPRPQVRVVGVVLAAGAGTRMGGPKAELVVDGVRLLDRAIAALAEGGCDEVVAVVPPGVVLTDRPALELPPVVDELTEVGVLRDGSAVPVRAVENFEASTGMRSSLRLAVAAGAGFDAMAVTLVDTPGVSDVAVRTVVDAFRERPDHICVAVYNGRRGHPTVMAVDCWRVAAEMAGPDEGARRYLADHAELVDEIAVSGEAVDLDTPADLERWLGR